MEGEGRQADRGQREWPYPVGPDRQEETEGRETGEHEPYLLPVSAHDGRTSRSIMLSAISKVLRLCRSAESRAAFRRPATYRMASLALRSVSRSAFMLS